VHDTYVDYDTLYESVEIDTSRGFDLPEFNESNISDTSDELEMCTKSNVFATLGKSATSHAKTRYS
jgi:hypothetical protein